MSILKSLLEAEDNSPHLVMCKIFGASTAPLKKDGKVVKFPNKEAAEAEAKKLRDSRSPHSSVQYHYWAEPA